MTARNPLPAGRGGFPPSLINQGFDAWMSAFEEIIEAERRWGCKLQMGTVTGVAAGGVDVVVEDGTLVEIEPLGAVGVDDVVLVLTDRKGTAVVFGQVGSGSGSGPVDWSDITNTPSTYPPTPEMLTLNQLADVNTAGVDPGEVLGWNGSVWVPVAAGSGGGAAPDEVWIGPDTPPSPVTELWYDEDAVPTGGGGGGGPSDWSEITNKPGSFPPDEHDAHHDDRFSQLGHTHPYALVEHDTAHDDRFSQLGHGHPAPDWATITGKPSTFTPTAQSINWLTDVDTSSPHYEGYILGFSGGAQWTPFRFEDLYQFAPPLDWLSNVSTTGQTSGHVLTYNGSSWVPLSPASGSPAWADITGKPTSFPSDWTTLTGKPSTFTPTPQALDWLTDVITTGNGTGYVLTWSGSTWRPEILPDPSWASITGKPTTFTPTPQDLNWLTDVNTAGALNGYVLGYNTATGWTPVSAPAPTAQPIDWLTDVSIGMIEGPPAAGHVLLWAGGGQWSNGLLNYYNLNPDSLPPPAWVQVTQAEYDALSPPDPDTLYVVVNP